MKLFSALLIFGVIDKVYGSKSNIYNTFYIQYKIVLFSSILLFGTGPLVIFFSLKSIVYASVKKVVFKIKASINNKNKQTKSTYKQINIFLLPAKVINVVFAQLHKS